MLETGSADLDMSCPGAGNVMRELSQVVATNATTRIHDALVKDVLSEQAFRGIAVQQSILQSPDCSDGKKLPGEYELNLLCLTYILAFLGNKWAWSD